MSKIAHTQEEANQQITDFLAYKKAFKYHDDDLYSLIFFRHGDKIKLNKEKFATRNLQKIFSATFQLVSKIGFQTMSLRDLSAETGLSMGGLYSTISYKENIAIIVKDVVALVCKELVEQAKAEDDPKQALETIVKGHLYASTILQPWFYFLYFETRSLPSADQEESKNIEIFTVAEISNLVDQIRQEQGAKPSSQLVATMTLAMIQEHYLKPWKYKKTANSVDAYADQCLSLIYSAID